MTAKKRALDVTLSDIARRLEVSKVTVSKALRGHADISQETVRRVKEIALELGYYPNYWARSLSSRTSNTIGVVVPKIAHFFFSSVIEAIYDAAFQQNYEIILTVSQEQSEREHKHIQTLLSMRVSGLIVSVSEQTRSHGVFDTVRQTGVPLTFMDRVIAQEGFNTVVADDRGGAFAAAEQAIRVGYRRLAHLAGYQHTNIGRERLRGFEAALKQHDIPLNPDWVVYGGFSEEDGYRGFMKLYASGRMPEFVFAVTFPVALGVYRAAQELGVKIPNDLDIISFGSSGLNHFLDPPMSYIEQPTRELGLKAVELTLEHIRQKDLFVPQHIRIPTKLMLQETCIRKVASARRIPGEKK